jgi:hypothetical protein
MAEQEGGSNSGDPTVNAKPGQSAPSVADNDGANDAAKASNDDVDGDGEDDEEDGEDGEEDEAQEDEEEETSDDPGGKRRPVVVIEDSVEAERATQVAAHQPDERPASMNGAIVGGLVGSMIGAVLWWGLIRVSGYELGLVAIGVGILSGLGVVRGGGRSSTNQIIGAVCGLAGILIGRVLFYYFGFDEMQAEGLAREHHATIEMARMRIHLAHETGELTLGTYMKNTMQAMDIVFFGIGMFEGWRIPRPLS